MIVRLSGKEFVVTDRIKSQTYGARQLVFSASTTRDKYLKNLLSEMKKFTHG